jgi:phage-related tail protein
MKNEQEAYNAKMNAKIQEQLNGWVALRENMTTFSLQIKSLGSYTMILSVPNMRHSLFFL